MPVQINCQWLKHMDLKTFQYSHWHLAFEQKHWVLLLYKLFRNHVLTSLQPSTNLVVSKTCVTPFKFPILKSMNQPNTNQNNSLDMNMPCEPKLRSTDQTQIYFHILFSNSFERRLPLLGVKAFQVLKILHRFLFQTYYIGFCSRNRVTFLKASPQPSN